MNGTSVMTALTALAFERAKTFANAHALITAWNSFVLHGQAAHFDKRIFESKPHSGSVEYAKKVRTFLNVSDTPELHPGRIQDPYSIRCTPHVLGVLLEALQFFAPMLEVELNGAGDNPLICPNTGDVLHGGNFYGGHIGFIADTLKSLIASSAETLERQLILLNHRQTNNGLPENLVLAPQNERHAHHGFKALEILASSLIAEALKLSMPASSFSRSTEGHNQDKVPMGSIAARELRTVLHFTDTLCYFPFLPQRKPATQEPKRIQALSSPAS